MPKISGGYFIKARQIRDSSIAHAAPCVREIWDYLLREANHSDEKYDGFILKRGQLFRNYKQIREDLCWAVGNRKETYSDSQIKHAMAFLKRERMAIAEKKPRGVLITVCNYDYFQDPKNYERTTNPERTTKLPTNEPENEPPNEPARQQATYCNNNEFYSFGNNERTTERTTKLPTNEPRCVYPLTRTKKQEINTPLTPQGENAKVYFQIVNYLNRKTGANFKPETKATKNHISARMKEGFTPEDFKTVIDFKCAQWLNDPEKQEYLRPHTLFNSKFESYLNAAQRKITLVPNRNEISPKTDAQIAAELKRKLI